MSHKQNWFWSLPLMGFLVVFFTQCESTTEEVKRTEKSSLSPVECFDYKYPITVVIENDTIEVVRFDQYRDLHLRCEALFTDFTRGSDPKGRDSLNRTPTGKGHSTVTGAGYGDCPQDNDPWCGEMLFPVTLLNVPDHTGEIVVLNDSILQYYRWFVCQ
jgi:hypothetical protein